MTYTSLPEPDKERVDSPLFDDLKGDWTATCQAQWQDYTGTYDQKVSFKVTLAGGPEQGPSSVSAMDSKDYDALFSYFKESAMKNGQDEATAEAYAKTKVAELFDEYKSEATRYAGKYRGQNRLVGLRFDAICICRNRLPSDADRRYGAASSGGRGGESGSFGR